MLRGTGQALGDGLPVRSVGASPPHEQIATMDLEPITTEPTTDLEPPSATPVVPGPSQVSGSSAAGRRRGTMVHRAAIGLALVLTFGVGIGVGGLAVSGLGIGGTTTPAPERRRIGCSGS